MRFINLPLVLVLIIGLLSCATQKNAAEIVALKNSVENRDFTFNAQQVLPRDYRISQIFPNANAQLYNLSPGYIVKVNGDSLLVDLPFFGRAFQAPVDPTKGGIKFATNSYEMRQSSGRKGTLEVNIYPRNTNDVQQMFLSISSSGYATLNVISNQRESINFYGIIQ